VPKPDLWTQILWVALAADASALLLAITVFISQNVAAVPLLWVLPLSLYLLSMILCFEGRRWYRRLVFLSLSAVALAGMTFALSADFESAEPLFLIPLFCAGLFFCCMVCHGELAELKPDPQHLTLFYLMVSTGGALGGVFVGAVAPYLFRGFYELSIAMAGFGVLLWIVLHRDSSTVFYRARIRLPSLAFTGLVVLLIVSLFDISRNQTKQTVLTARNFYGFLRIRDYAATDLEPRHRDLVNGTTLHGTEILDPGRSDEATTYYNPESGVGLALLAPRRQGGIRAGIIGLGAGTLASYGRVGDRYTFYEINPLVTEIAYSQFHFLRDSRAEIEIVPGDARLSLERQPPQGFDVLVVDAFSGDAIPVHLLTIEAFRLYFGELKPEGVIAVHVSNRFLDLAPIVLAAGHRLGAFSQIISYPADRPTEVATSTWVLLAKNDQALAEVGSPFMTLFTASQQNLPPWTDDWSNLLGILQ
jgi:spermidine synthase